MSKKNIIVDPKLCIGCRQCALSCSFVHENLYSVNLSRIKIITNQQTCQSTPVVCLHCDDAPCKNACPVGAIERNKETGILEINQELCIGCKQCVKACPQNVIVIHSVKKIALKCDLCNGDPECVKSCPTNALKFV